MKESRKIEFLSYSISFSGGAAALWSTYVCKYRVGEAYHYYSNIRMISFRIYVPYNKAIINIDFPQKIESTYLSYLTSKMK